MAVLFSSASVLPGWVPLVMLLLSIVSLWIVRQEFGNRAAAFTVVLLLVLCPLVLRAQEDDGVVIYSDCDGLTPSDWQYWVRGCWAR